METKSIHFCSKPKGFSLIGVMISLVAMSLIYVAYRTTVDVRKRAILASQTKQDLLTLRHTIRESFSCGQTFGTAEPCGTPGPFDMKTFDGTTLIKKAGSQIGPYTLRATCNNKKEVHVSYQVDGSSKKDLFNDIPIVCANSGVACDLVRRSNGATCTSDCYIDFGATTEGFAGLLTGGARESDIFLSGSPTWNVDITTSYSNSPLTSSCSPPDSAGCELNFKGANQPLNYATFSVDLSANHVSGNDYQAPLEDVVPPEASDWFDRRIDVTFTPTSPAGPSCNLTIRLNSPLVLHFPERGPFAAIHPLDSRAKFDLLGHGRKVRTGWITPSSAFLALDLNRDGRIGDGTELFGQGTMTKSGHNAENGFSALADYDVNGDGVIDKLDPVFDSLLLWFDQDLDGVSQTHELFSLQSFGITRIDLDYKMTNQEQFLSGGMGANSVPYVSSYYGPAHCEKGCPVYDIYFSSIDSQVVTNVR